MKPQFIFKQKILFTLIASVLGVTTANTNAAECNILGTEISASGATPVSTGPLNPVDGFPEYVTDSTGISVQRCTDPGLCFFDPIVPTDPFSLQIGTGSEAFYWSADAVVTDTVGNKVLSLGLAAETAFLENGPNGELINGSQFPFLRMRFVMGVPVNGTYTVKHPYGTDIFTVATFPRATGFRDVFSTIDRGFAPNEQGVQGPVGPFLKSVSAPFGYMGDAGAASDLVTGSPCGPVEAPWNYVEVTGVDTQGNTVQFGNGETVLRTDKFTIQGKLYDGQVQTPLTPTRLSYSRSATGPAQIDTFANSTNTATVTATDGPTNPADSATIGAPMTLDRSASNLTDAVNSLSIPMATESAAKLPSIVQVSASDATAIVPTDPTTLNLHLLDFVDIAKADYDPATDTLSVSATSSDKRLSPTLTLRDFGNFAAGTPVKLVTTIAPPAEVHVDSAAGGTAVAQVRVIDAVLPYAPSGLALMSATSTTLTLKWIDNSTNEKGFMVYLVDTITGIRTLKATVAANTLQATVTGLAASQEYNLQVDAYNLVGANSSELLKASTLGLMTAPTRVTPTLITVPLRGIKVSWADNSSDETGFVISRSTTADGTYVQVATAPANATSAVDTQAKVNGTTYFYKVAAARGIDRNDSLVSNSVTTPNATTSAGTPTFTGVVARAVTVNWVDNSTNETSYQVYRRTGTGGTFVAVGAILPAGTVSLTDSAVAASTEYFYRVDAINWAGATPSLLSSVTTQSMVLGAPRGLTASNASQPVLIWEDTNIIETGYRVSARPITFTATGVATTNAALIRRTNPDLVPESISYTDAGALTANALYQYSVSAMNSGVVGTAATVYAVPGGIPTPINLTAVRATRGFAIEQSVVTLRWSALTAPAVGGYRVELCTVTGTQNCNGNAGWVAAKTTPATLAGSAIVTATSVLPANTVGIIYRFRLIATTGSVVTGINSEPSLTASVTR